MRQVPPKKATLTFDLAQADTPIGTIVGAFGHST
jgi:hypothetical protein